MPITLPDTRSLSDDVLEALRLRAIWGCQMGFLQADIALLLCVAPETISRWWSAYCAEGPNGLPGERTGRPTGSGRTLSPEQETHLQDLIDHHTPEDLGIAAPLWNRKAVQQLIRKETQIGMPIRTVGEYLKRWGYTCKKPRRHHKKQDPEEVQEWVEKTYPDLEKQAQKEGAVIFWVDETGVAADAYPGSGYARKGERATIEVPDPHINMNVISAISNDGSVRFMTYPKTMNSDLFLVFLKRLVRSVPEKVYVIVDRLKAHNAKKVWQWVDQHEDQIKMVLSPRRAPELNVDEYLNNDLKENVYVTGLPNNEKELRQRIQSFLQRLVHWPTHVMSYFQHPSAQYASGY
jgi:transposase